MPRDDAGSAAVWPWGQLGFVALVFVGRFMARFSRPDGAGCRAGVKLRVWDRADARLGSIKRRGLAYAAGRRPILVERPPTRIDQPSRSPVAGSA